jgi:thymidylate synthase (FAD)
MEKGHTIKVLDHGFVRYIDHMGTDTRIVEAARVSYGKGSKGEEEDKKLLNYLYKNKHTSPFEMVKVTLNIKMPIFVMRQYVRHRMQNMNEYSLRYSEARDEFYIPNEWRTQDKKNKQSSNAGFFTKDEDLLFSDELGQFCDKAFKLYTFLIEKGVAREMARMCLPLNLYTEAYVCWDMKNLIHFISLRDDSHAQAEIQEYGRAIKAIVKKLFPWTMEAYEKYKFQLVEV